MSCAEEEKPRRKTCARKKRFLVLALRQKAFIGFDWQQYLPNNERDTLQKGLSDALTQTFWSLVLQSRSYFIPNPFHQSLMVANPFSAPLSSTSCGDVAADDETVTSGANELSQVVARRLLHPSITGDNMSCVVRDKIKSLSGKVTRVFT